MVSICSDATIDSLFNSEGSDCSRGSRLSRVCVPPPMLIEVMELDTEEVDAPDSSASGADELL